MSPVITDEAVITVLARTVAAIDPVLDWLSSADPLGLRERTWRVDSPAQELSRQELSALEAALDRAADLGAWVLNTVQVPGTRAWSERSITERCQWWVWRVGAFNNLLVAYPGVFGALLQRLPLQDALAFGNQAIVLVAVAREHGITDPDRLVEMLSEVLLQRHVDLRLPQQALGAPVTALEVKVDEVTKGWRPLRVAGASWRIARMVMSVPGELVKRPHPRTVFNVLGNLPVVGLVADYIGEFEAMIRAARAGQAWIASHPS